MPEISPGASVRQPSSWSIRPSLSALSEAAEVIRNLLSDRRIPERERIATVTPNTHKPGPQPSPMPGMPPAILNIDSSEYQEYLGTIVRRYVHTLTHRWPESLRYAITHPGIDVLTDAALAQMVWTTPFSRFLAPLDASDYQRFASVIGHEPETLFKIDHSFLKHHEPLPDLHILPTIGLFQRTGEGLSLVAISANERVVTPADEALWLRAKAFFSQGCSIKLPLGSHPLLHFPMDSVISVSRQTFPADHPLRQLIEAHSYLQLPLNYGVLHHPRSVAHNHPQEIYTPFPSWRDGIFAGIADHYQGVPGNAAYPAYQYPLSAPDFPGRFCTFLRRYYAVIQSFCREVVDTVAPGDPAVAAWGEALHCQLPGFPSPEALQNPEILTAALAGFVHTVTVWHSADHHGYGAESLNAIPLRLRLRGLDDDTPPEHWVRRADIFRHHIAREMFFQPNTIRPLLSTEYGFAAPGLRQATTRFFDALHEVDQDPLLTGQIPLSEIACSIQF